jgi:hypothetical protein
MGEIMTKKHFEILAHTIGTAQAKSVQNLSGAALTAAISTGGGIEAGIAAALAAANPLFDVYRFTAAVSAARVAGSREGA